MVPRGAGSTIGTAVHGRATAAEQHRRPGVQARRRRGPASVQHVIVGVVERERPRLLDSRLREHSVANISGSMTAALMILNLVIVFCLRYRLV